MLFDPFKVKQKKQTQYVNDLKQAMINACPDIESYPFTLTTANTDDLNAFKEAAKELMKNAALHFAANLVGMRVRTKVNYDKTTCFITCFKNDEIYFLSIGNGSNVHGGNRNNIEVDQDNVFLFKKSEIKGVTVKKKKITFILEEDATFTFTYGVNTGTVFDVPNGDSDLLDFVNSI